MYNQAVGVYTPITQLEFNKDSMISLGFTKEEIDILEFSVVNQGKVTVNSLVNMGLDYENAKRIKYMWDIIKGTVPLENTEDLVKHLRKMWGNKRRLSISDLLLSKVSKVPRKAVVAGIKDEKFKILNSNNYDVEDRLYDVVSISGSRITIKTDRKPVLKYGESLNIEGVLEVKEILQDKNIIVAIDKKYAKVCNRFIIVGSLRRPEFHHGLVEIICIEGTRVYIFAQTMGTKEYVKYSGELKEFMSMDFYRQR